jgi:hypothetical protein
MSHQDYEALREALSPYKDEDIGPMGIGFVRRLLSERDALEADARRLDFLNSRDGRLWLMVQSITSSTPERWRAAVDAAIDAASTKEPT